MKSIPKKRERKTTLVAMEMSAEDTQIAHVTGNHTARRALQTQLIPLPWKRSTIGYCTLCAVSQQDSRSPHWHQNTSRLMLALATQQTSTLNDNKGQCYEAWRGKTFFFFFKPFFFMGKPFYKWLWRLVICATLKSVFSTAKVHNSEDRVCVCVFVSVHEWVRQFYLHFCLLSVQVA